MTIVEALTHADQHRSKATECCLMMRGGTMADSLRMICTMVKETRSTPPSTDKVMTRLLLAVCRAALLQREEEANDAEEEE
jgi:hypothetical protein